MSNRVSPQAAAAKAIKAELKAAFPEFKFSVTSESFSGGNAVRIHWIDGPTTSQVKAITDKYQYGSFNGMEDRYDVDNCIDGLPQAKYVTVSRDSSEEVKLEIAAELGFDGVDIKSGYCNERREYYATLIYREFCQRSYIASSTDQHKQPEPEAKEEKNEVPEYTYQYRLGLMKSQSENIFGQYKITSAREAHAIGLKIWEHGYDIEVREKFVAVFVNKAHVPVGWAEISAGGTGGTVVDVKHLLAHAILCNASAMVIYHNHPSGNVSPSQADISLTKKIRSACDLLEIPMLDHLVISQERYYSFAEEGI